MPSSIIPSMGLSSVALAAPLEAELGSPTGLCLVVALSPPHFPEPAPAPGTGLETGSSESPNWFPAGSQSLTFPCSCHPRSMPFSVSVQKKGPGFPKR